MQKGTAIIFFRLLEEDEGYSPIMRLLKSAEGNFEINSK
jgi:hypothetical protein